MRCLIFFKVRGQHYAIDLCGTLDVLRPVILLMLRTQAVNLPPWKIVTWFARVMEILKKIEANLKDLQSGSKPCKELLPKLSEHWEEFNVTKDDDDSTTEGGTFQVI